MRSLCKPFLCAAILPMAWAPMAHAAVETQNLLRNGDFEQPGMPPPGWKIDVTKGARCQLVPDALTGHKALKVALPASGAATVTSDPCAVTAGDDYVFTFWSRGDGQRKKGGVTRCYIVWQDASGKGVGSIFTQYYGPEPDYRAATYTATAPKGAARACIRYRPGLGRDYKGPPTAFYIDQVRFMKLSASAVPANPQKWEYVPRRVRSGLELVADADAARGQALVAKLGSARKGVPVTFGPNTMAQPVGDYLAVFRLKVASNREKAPVAMIDVAAVGNFNSGLARRTVLATDFKKAGVYQDITLRFVRPPEGSLELRVFYQGTTDLWVDTKNVVQLSAFPTDKDQAAIWWGGSDMALRTPDSTTFAHGNTVLVLAGLGHRICFPQDALTQATGLPFKYAYMVNARGLRLDQPFPKRLDGLNGVGVVVMANVSASALNGFVGRSTLRRFVERGGGLLVFGGPFSLGKGEMAGCAFEPALPVTTTGPWDLVRAESGIVKVAKASPITAGLAWSGRPVLVYYQKTAAKPGADVLLECDGFPMLVTGRYGKGRVAVFAGTYLGAPGKGAVLFCQWPDYTTLLTRVIRWLRGV